MRKIKEDKIQKAIHNELVEQFKGMVQIEIGNYAYDKHLTLCYDTYPDFNVWIKDSSFEEDGYFEDICQVMHLHYEDILWAILNFNKIKNDAMRYIKIYLDSLTLEDKIIKGIVKVKIKEHKGWLPIVERKEEENVE